MIFTELKLPGAVLLEPERRGDERGFFARVWCEKEYEAHGLTTRVAQVNVSRTRTRGTIRGMHYQLPPHAEAKTVRCTKGAILDVIVDLRPDSPTFGGWVGVELTAENHRMLYVPEGFAHGFQTLDDDVEVTYLVSEPYAPGAERGVRYDDPAFAIDWPLPVSVVSEKDLAWPAWASAPLDPAAPLHA